MRVLRDQARVEEFLAVLLQELPGHGQQEQAVIDMFLGCLFGGAISAAAFGSVTTRPVRRFAVVMGLSVAAFGLAGTAVTVAVSQ